MIEDDADVRDNVHDLLKGEGFYAVEARDGREGLKEAHLRQPDLIICDVMMPHMDGFEFIAALKADRTLPPIPVIFLTSMEEGDTRSRELGAVGFLTKPVRADRLLKMVAEHVPGDPLG